MKKGISLVALVVTIIVLIILAGAVILTALDVNIFERAKLAKEQKNLKEVYVAVQNEVLGVQQEKIGLAVSTEFATHLQARLLKNYPTSNATATYNSGSNSIGITFDLSNKTYELSLDRKYRLTMLTTVDEGQSDNFIADLELAMEKYFDESTGTYNLYDIQQEMDKKYPNAEYLYILSTGNIRIPVGINDTILNFVVGDNVGSQLFTVQIKNGSTTVAIENGELKDELSVNPSHYLLEEEASELYEYSNNEITLYKGNESIVNVPVIILTATGYDRIDIIGENAFGDIETELQDIIIDVLNSDYDTYNGMTEQQYVEVMSSIDSSFTSLYQSGMTKDEYTEAIIKSMGGVFIKKDGHLYTYRNGETFTSAPRTNPITEIIIDQGIQNIDIKSNAFKNSNQLKTIRFNTLIHELSSNAFANCGLTDIYMPLYTKEEVQALTNYSTNKWGAPQATIHCSDGDL